MVPVEVAEDGKEAEEDGDEYADMPPLISEEPEALKTLVSCGAHWQLQCLHGEQLCQKHAVAKAFMEMVPVQDSPRKNVATREQMSLWGKQGQEQRMETLKLRKMNAGKPEVMQRLKNSEKQKYGELLEKAMPIKFSDHFLTSSWTSHSSVFGLNLAPCWLPAWLHVGSMLASSWPHVGSSWLENRSKCVPNRFILALGDGLGGILEHLEASLNQLEANLRPT